MRLFVLIHSSSSLATVYSIHPSCDRLSYNFLDILLSKFYKSHKSVKTRLLSLNNFSEGHEGNPAEGILRKLSLPLLKEKECREAVDKVTRTKPSAASNSFLCAGSLGKTSACYVCISSSQYKRESWISYISSCVHTLCEYSLCLQPQNTRSPSITSWPLPPSQSTMAVGSPLACGVRGRWFLAGLASWTGNCAVSGGPGVFTRMTAFSNWLRESSVLMRRRKYPKTSNT